MDKSLITNSQLTIAAKNGNTSIGNGSDRGKSEISSKNKWKRRGEGVHFEKSERRVWANTKRSSNGHFGERKTRSRETNIWNKMINKTEPDLVDGHVRSSKKHNLNHLLNFSFSPRENHSARYIAFLILTL